MIPVDYFGCYVSVVTTYHKQVSIESDIIELARDYDHQLKQERLPGDAIFPVHHSKQDIIDALSSWEGHRDRFSMGVTVTNIGLLPFNTQYSHLKWKKAIFVHPGKMQTYLFCSMFLLLMSNSCFALPSQNQCVALCFRRII